MKKILLFIAVAFCVAFVGVSIAQAKAKTRDHPSVVALKPDSVALSYHSALERGAIRYEQIRQFLIINHNQPPRAGSVLLGYRPVRFCQRE